MPDICMCHGEGCKKKDMCYRYRAVPSKYLQSYFIVPPIENEVCKHFISIEQHKIRDIETIENNKDL